MTMKTMQYIPWALVVVCVGLAPSASAVIRPGFDPALPGLYVPLDTDMTPVAHGLYQSGSGWTLSAGWAQTGVATGPYARYETTLADEATMTAMPTDRDWVLEVIYQHTGAYRNDMPWYTKHYERDDRMVALACVGTDQWRLRVGNALGSWSNVGSTFALGQTPHRFTLHFKAANQRMDFWLDDNLTAGDFQIVHGRYDVNHIQIQRLTADSSGQDWYRSVRIGQLAASRLDFGKRWVREHPFTIMGLCLTNEPHDIPLYVNAGMNTMLAWKSYDGILGPSAAAGLPRIDKRYALDGVNGTLRSGIETLLATYAGNVGWLMNDEPAPEYPEELDILCEVLEWLRAYHPEKLAFSNVGGQDTSDPSLVQLYLDRSQPDVMMYDHYPFDPSSSDGIPDVYWQRIGIIREKALLAGLPYWCFVQSYEPQTNQYLSESDIRMLMFVPLTYGFTGFGYFTYDKYLDTHVGLLDQSSNPSELHSYAASANPEVARLGKYLRFLTNERVYFIRSVPSTAVPSYLTAWQPGGIAGDHITSVAIQNSGSAEKNGLIGYFRDDAGQTYFMLTNLWRNYQAGGGTPATNRSLTFQLTFDSSVRSVLRWNRQTDSVERLAVTPTQGLTVTLPGGTGDLFKYETGPFPEQPVVRGKVSLGNYVGDFRDTVVRVEFRKSGTAARTERVFLDTDGAFEVYDLAPGTYDIAVKASHWLQKVLTGRAVSTETDLGTIALINGDCDGDNSITSTDVSIGLANMNKTDDP